LLLKGGEVLTKGLAVIMIGAAGRPLAMACREPMAPDAIPVGAQAACATGWTSAEAGTTPRAMTHKAMTTTKT
jgi:hypothetical protein